MVLVKVKEQVRGYNVKMGVCHKFVFHIDFDVAQVLSKWNKLYESYKECTHQILQGFLQVVFFLDFYDVYMLFKIMWTYYFVIDYDFVLK
jgi:hypothetical protein